VYLPATTAMLRTLVAEGAMGPAPMTAFAVTPGLREWYVDDDVEELEYAAMSDAARASLRLLSADQGSARRRAVVAADVADSAVEIRDDLDRGVVRLSAPIPMSDIASVHLDDSDAESAVAAAVDAVDAADLGDPHAQERTDDVEGYELSWYATQELDALLELM
jgi:Arc/MetJ-type ribon-helix-helix transcriptional regulator